MKRYREQDHREIFAHFPYNGPIGETWEAPFERLARMAKPEKWAFQRPEIRDQYRSQHFPILTNYLNYTFMRLQEEGKIRFSPEGDKACFNTGLQTSRGKDIYATFFKNKHAIERDQPDWTLYAFVDSYSTKLDPFMPLPGIASYIDDVRDLVFEPSYSIEPNLEHILTHNEDRLPELLRGNIRMAENVINGELQSLVGRIRRNYKMAVPHWYENKIQLLLPLVLTNDEGIADLALVVDRDDTRGIYRGKTILTMDMAYVDARLIAKPSDDWLEP